MDTYIDSKKNDLNFKKLLKAKHAKNVMSGRYNMEAIVLASKSKFIIRMLLAFKDVLSLTYRIMYWEQDERIEHLIKSKFSNKKYELAVSYKNGQRPGIIYLEDKAIDTAFLTTLLDNHFNYEMAKDPSINMRIQLCLNQADLIILFDIYDDRGFDMYYYSINKSHNHN